jgi:3D (Asp-Asp-Asp) domain-containing protein
MLELEQQYNAQGKSYLGIGTTAVLLRAGGLKGIETIDGADAYAIVDASVYHATYKECDNTPHILSSNIVIDTTQADKYRYIAVSRDLLNQDKWFSLQIGDTVQVSGTWTYDGLWIVQDVLNARYTNTIDFLIAKGQYEHKWKDVKIIKLIN